LVGAGALLADALHCPGQIPNLFFSDEAIQTMTARDLVSRGLRDLDGSLFPVYFENGGQYNLSLSVWLQVVITGLPNSVWLTRGLSALISLLFPFLAGSTCATISKRGFGG